MASSEATKMGRSQIVKGYVKDAEGIFKNPLYSEGDREPLKGVNHEDVGVRLAVKIIVR